MSDSQSSNQSSGDDGALFVKRSLREKKDAFFRRKLADGTVLLDVIGVDDQQDPSSEGEEDASPATNWRAAPIEKARIECGGFLASPFVDVVTCFESPLDLDAPGRFFDLDAPGRFFDLDAVGVADCTSRKCSVHFDLGAHHAALLRRAKEERSRLLDMPSSMDFPAVALDDTPTTPVD
jgi:hypothetical protein